MKRVPPEKSIFFCLGFEDKKNVNVRTKEGKPLPGLLFESIDGTAHYGHVSITVILFHSMTKICNETYEDPNAKYRRVVLCYEVQDLLMFGSQGA